MKQYKYMSDLYALAFLFLGVAFIVGGCLSFVNIIKPTGHSLVQDHIVAGVIFYFIGIVFYVIHAVCRLLSYKHKKLHNKLISTGTKMIGIIEEISIQKWIRFGKYRKKSPFIIYYTYLYENKNYQHKSYLFWDKPNLSKGDKIDIFVNDFGQSTFVL